VRVRDQPRQPRNQENRVPELVGEAQIGADRRDRAVDIDRQRPPERVMPRVEGTLGGAKQPWRNSR